MSKRFFHEVHVWRLSTKHDVEEFESNRREELVVADLNYVDSIACNQNENGLWYEVLKNKLNSSFWIEWQCFFHIL